MLSNAYFLAKFRFDTAENEPAKNLQNFRKMHFRKMHFQKMHCHRPGGRPAAERASRGELLRPHTGQSAVLPFGRAADTRKESLDFTYSA